VKPYVQFTLRLPQDDADFIRDLAGKVTGGNVHEVLVRFIHRARQLYGILAVLRERHNAEANREPDTRGLENRSLDSNPWLYPPGMRNQADESEKPVATALDNFRHLLPTDRDDEVAAL